MSVYGISDLHLAIDMPEKSMEIFGDRWKNYMARIRENWLGTVTDRDTVIVAGDISWQLRYDPMSKDLEYLKSLPGRKILVRGNHDFWWRREATNKIQRDMPENITLLMGRSIYAEGIWFCGTRGWRIEKGTDETASAIIFDREIRYLRRALEEVPENAKKAVVLHYPPFNEDLKNNIFARCAKEHGAEMIIYGHIHGGQYLEGNIDGTEYRYISSDGLDFCPKLLFP